MSTEDLVKRYETPPPQGNPREVEAWALTQAALRMKAAKDRNDAEAMLAAIRLNWQLWTIIQAELLAPDCPVPPDIRRNVLSLANFIDKHTISFIAEPEPAKLDVLISINRELAGGLYTVPTEGGADEEPSGMPGGGGADPVSTNTSA